MNDLNVAVLIGEVITEPVQKVLSNGDMVVNCDVAAVTDEGRTVVPIVVTGTDAHIAMGDNVCVVGFMRKRFFQTPAGLQSRTELAVHKSARVRQKAQVKKILERAVQDLRDASRT